MRKRNEVPRHMALKMKQWASGLGVRLSIDWSARIAQDFEFVNNFYTTKSSAILRDDHKITSRNP